MTLKQMGGGKGDGRVLLKLECLAGHLAEYNSRPDAPSSLFWPLSELHGAVAGELWVCSTQACTLAGSAFMPSSPKWEGRTGTMAKWAT